VANELGKDLFKIQKNGDKVRKDLE